MRLFWVLGPLLLLLLVWFYLYIIVRRGIYYFRKERFGTKEKVAAVAVSVLILAASLLLGGMWLLFLLHFSVLMLVLDLVCRVSARLRKKDRPPFGGRIYGIGAAAVLLSVLILGYGYWNMGQVVKQEYTVKVEKPMREEGYRIALVSDLHYGTTMDGDKLLDEAERIAGENPDLVLLGGDIVDEGTSLEEMKEAFDILGRIQAPYGVYFVYGNHDRSPYSPKPNYTKKQLADQIEKAGIVPLEDVSVEIGEDLLLVGRADRSETRSSAEELVSGLDPGKVLVLADHQPCEYEEVEAAGVDLILSGHTHGGQIWPGATVATLFAFDDQNYGYGRYGDLQAIVTSGIGGWGFPVRTERHSEFVMIKLEGP